MICLQYEYSYNDMSVEDFFQGGYEDQGDSSNDDEVYYLDLASQFSAAFANCYIGR
jgi:hypothetical protein